MEVDDKNYRFQVSMYLYLDWIDPRAAPEIERRTAEVRGKQADGEDAECERVCSGPSSFRSSWQKCCDTVWLPNLPIVNVEELPEGRVPYERIQIGGVNKTAVAWIINVQGVFYAGMEFRDFPFDEQNLNINFWLDTHGYPGETLIRLIPSATSVSTAFEETVGQRKGNDVNGWTINAVTLNTTLLPLADAFLDRRSNGRGYRYQDPHPNEPISIVDYTRIDSLNGSDDVYGHEEGYQAGFYISLAISRVSYIHVMNLLLPIFLCIWLGCIVLYIEPRDLDTRIGTVVTLFLALVAVQFVSQDVQPSSANMIATQQLIVMTYLYLAILAVQSLISYSLCTGYENYQREQKFKQGEIQAISELEGKGIRVSSTLPFKSAPPKLRRSRNLASAERRVVEEGAELEEVTSGESSGAHSINNALKQLPARERAELKKASARGDGARVGCLRKASAALWYMPRNIREVEHYGSYIAFHMDRAVLLAWIVSYHVFALLIFVLNDITA